MNRDPQTGSSAEQDESRLIARARAGDAAAMAALLQSYHRRVFSLCWRMVNHREDAADLAQDVLARMLTGLSGFDGRSSLSTWVYRLAVNASISHLRRRRTRTKGQPVAGTGPPDLQTRDSWPQSVADGEPTPEESVQTTEDRALLQSALGSLSDEARALLVLRDGRGLDYETISEVLDLPLGTVKSRLFRSRLALRKAVQELENSAVKSTAQ